MKTFLLAISVLFAAACGKEDAAPPALYTCPPPIAKSMTRDECITALSGAALNAAKVAEPPVQEPRYQLEIRSAKFVPQRQDVPSIPLVVTNQTNRDTCIAALAAPAPTPSTWQQEFQNGVSVSKVAETEFLAAEKAHRDCASLLAGDQTALTELRLRYARAMYTLATVSDYPFGFPYSESFRHTTVDLLVQFLVDFGLTPSQVRAELTGAALAELRKRSFRELYQIALDNSGKYTEDRVGDAVIGLCTEIRKGARAQTEIGLTDIEIQAIDCD